jgi:molecular chaperone DnaK
LDGIPPAPRGVPQIEVSFDIDANGILNVQAVDKATGKSQSIRVEASTSLTKEEVERLRREAELHAEEDRRKKELAEARNQGEALIYTAEKSLREAGDKIGAELKSEINEKLDILKTALGGENRSLIEEKIADLSQSLQKIGEVMYKERKDEGEQAADEPQSN